jgi:hypothetical protein
MPSDFFPQEELNRLTDEMKRIKLALVALMTKEQEKRFRELLETDKLLDNRP